CGSMASRADMRRSCGQNGTSGQQRAMNSSAGATARNARLPTPHTAPARRNHTAGSDELVLPGASVMLSEWISMLASRTARARSSVMGVYNDEHARGGSIRENVA